MKGENIFSSSRGFEGQLPFRSEDYPGFKPQRHACEF